MSILRVPFSILAGVLFSSAVFLALYEFVNVQLNFEPAKSVVIDFTPKRVQTPIESTRDPKIERPPPTSVPESGHLIVDNFGSGGGTTAIVRPPIEVIRPTRGGIGTDHDAIPFIRVVPDYPPRAQARGIEGWVQIQFAITEIGTVRDPVVVAAEPQGVFEDAALKAIARWRYNPRIDGGIAVERVGLQTVIRFQLNQ